MAQNPALTQLLTALNAAPHPGMGNDFFAHVGSHMALARTVPPAWFPKTGTATEAQIGGLIANLHSLTTVAWGAYRIPDTPVFTSNVTEHVPIFYWHEEQRKAAEAAQKADGGRAP